MIQSESFCFINYIGENKLVELQLLASAIILVIYKVFLKILNISTFVYIVSFAICKRACEITPKTTLSMRRKLTVCEVAQELLINKLC